MTTSWPSNIGLLIGLCFFRYDLLVAGKRKTIKLMAEYGNTVLWHADSDEVGPIEIDSLPLSSELKVAIRRWAAAYNETLDDEYPPHSGFANEAEENAFNKEGERIWRTLQAELGPNYKILYSAEKTAFTQKFQK